MIGTVLTGMDRTWMVLTCTVQMCTDLTCTVQLRSVLTCTVLICTVLTSTVLTGPFCPAHI